MKRSNKYITRKYQDYLSIIGENHSVGEFSINYERTDRLFRKDVIVKKSTDSFNLIREFWPKSIDYIETGMLICLNRANQYIGHAIVSVGNDVMCTLAPKIIMQHLLIKNARAFILAHNHPSGNLSPSEPDKQVTQRVKQAGQLLDLQLIDHLIVTRDGYYSFADEGEL
jgi:DNA repair protein RadC